MLTCVLLYLLTLLLQALAQHVAKQMAEHSHQLTHAAPGVEWVRGWNDIGKAQQEQQAQR
jgi:hypothetical protein